MWAEFFSLYVSKNIKLEGKGQREGRVEVRTRKGQGRVS